MFNKCKIRSYSFFSQVEPSKQEEDDQCIGFMYGEYFNKNDRQEAKVQFNGESKLLSLPARDGKHMYALSLGGSLYVGDPTVHSQFKAGKPVITAGHLVIDNAKVTYVDNHSGHYCPSLRAFLLGACLMMKRNYLSKTGCEILLNPLTKPSKEGDAILPADVATFFTEAQKFVGRKNVTASFENEQGMEMFTLKCGEDKLQISVELIERCLTNNTDHCSADATLPQSQII